VVPAVASSGSSILLDFLALLWLIFVRPRRKGKVVASLVFALAAFPEIVEFEGESL
jgi:hypothetical protein